MDATTSHHALGFFIDKRSIAWMKKINFLGNGCNIISQCIRVPPMFIVMCDVNKWMPSGLMRCVLHTTLWRKPTIAHMGKALARFKRAMKSIANDRWNLAWWLVRQPIISHVPTPSPQHERKQVWCKWLPNNPTQT
jgi:hypothetical protein